MKIKWSAEGTGKVNALLLFMIAITVVAAIFVSRQGYSVAWGFVLAFSLLCLLVNAESMFYVFLFCFPISGILKLSETSITILPILNLVIIGRMLIGKKIRLGGYQVVLLMALLCLQIGCILAYNASVVSIVSFFVSVVCVICSASFFQDYENEGNRIYVNAVVFYTASLCLSIILSDWLPVLMHIVSRKKQLLLEAVGRFGALFVEPNEFAQAVLVGIGLLLSILPMIKHILGKITVLSAIVFLGLSGYRSQSKSYVLALMIMFVVFMVLCFRGIRKKSGLQWLLVWAVPVTVVAIAGFGILYKYIVVPTFEGRDNVDFLTGRGDIWKWYLDAFLNRVDVVLWGTGAGNAAYLHSVNKSIGNTVPHNTYLEYIIQFGVLGIGLLSVIFAKILRGNREKLTAGFWLPATAFLTTAFGISANANDCIFMLLLLAAMPHIPVEAESGDQNSAL